MVRQDNIIQLLLPCNFVSRTLILYNPTEQFYRIIPIIRGQQDKKLNSSEKDFKPEGN